jgi:hypothetical protein
MVTASSKTLTHVIGLGFNCEVDFKIHKYYKGAQSYAYTWCLVGNRKLFIDSLSNLDHLLDGPHSPYKRGLETFNRYQISFHLRESLLTTAVPSEQAMPELFSRETHLIEKTKGIFQDSKAHLIFLQTVQAQSFETDRNYTNEVADVLSKICASSQITVFFIFEGNKVNQKQYRSLEQGIIKIRFVRHFSEPKDRGDLWGWLRILKETGKGQTLRFIYSDSPFLCWLFKPLVQLAHHLKKH